MKQDFYDSLHIDFKDACHRFLDNEDLFLQMLKMFPDDPSFSQLKQAIDDNDVEAAFYAAHTLKGVCGNYSMTRLYALNFPLVEELRHGDMSHAKSRLSLMEDEYNLIVNAIKTQL